MRKRWIGVFLYPKTNETMAVASGFNFERIQIGDIFSNIGNHGMSSSDVAAMMIGVEAARSNREKEAEEDLMKDRERRLIIAAGSTIGIGLFILIIYLITLKIQKS